MGNLITFTTALCLLCGALAGCDSTSDTTTTPADDGRAALQTELRGAWLSACSPVQGSDPPAYAVFEVKNGGETGTFRYGVYVDAACKTPFIDFILESKQEVGAALPAIGEGVHELNIYYKKQTAIPHMDAAVQMIQGMGCGTGPYAVDAEVDTSMTGCVSFKPISACAADYDIMKIDQDKFYNGARTDTMCVPEGRPTALNAFWFQRTE